MVITKSITRIFSVSLIIVILIGSFVFPNIAHAAGILYVTQGGTGNCSSWANACGLQTALTTSISGDEIWVAAGTYKPTTTAADYTATFQLKENVAVYGGFTGTEATISERNPVTNTTVLSGDVNGDDMGFTNNSENVYHVVTNANNTTMDGFIIIGGNANGGTASSQNGGGIFNNTGNITLANITFQNNRAYNNGGGMYNASGSNTILSNVTFNENKAQSKDGGGMYNDWSSNSTLSNVTFNNNSAYWRGGGMSNGPYNSLITDSNVVLNNVIFNGNSAYFGGGFSSSRGSLTLTNVTFSNNLAYYMCGGLEDGSIFSTLTNVNFNDNIANNTDGGGMCKMGGSSTLTNVTFTRNHGDIGGGILNSNSSPVFSNVTFNDNTGQIGGGMGNWNASPTLNNVTFSNNYSYQYGGGIGNMSSSNPTIRNTILWGNTAYLDSTQIYNNGSTSIVSNSVVQGGYPGGTNIIAANPLLGTIDNNGGFTQTISLLAGSPAIDMGDDAFCPTTDQRGMMRPQGIHCDIGAFEVSVPTPTVHSFVVTTPANNLNIPITSFRATDDVAVTGYLITTSSTVPAAGAVGWNGTAPITYTVSSAGSYTLYPWAKDAAGNVSAVFVAPRAVVVDTTVPRVTFITGVNLNPTNLASVSFTVTFSESVTGVDTALPFNDFSLTTTGVTGASITSVTPVSGTTYTVRVNTGSGAGTIRLNVVDDNSIVDAASNPLGGAGVGDGTFLSGEVYTITQPVQDVITDTWAVKISPSANPNQLATQLGAQNLGQIGSLTGYYLFRVPGSATQSGTVAALFTANPQVLWFEQQVAHQQSKREDVEAISPTMVVVTAIAATEIVAFQDNAGDVSAINTLPATSSPEPTQTGVTIIQSFPTATQSFTAVPVSMQSNISPLPSPTPAQITITQIPPSSIPTKAVQSAKIAALPNEPSLIPTPMIHSAIPSTDSENRSGNGGTIVAVMITLSLAAGGIFFSLRRKK